MLKRLFIKDYKNTSDPNVRNAYGKVAGVFGIFTNLILGIIKFVIGIISNSVSIMADAINNIADTASSILTINGYKLASKKPDKKHPYGYARYEYISGFVIALLMLLMGLTFAKESIIKIFNPEELTINAVTYIILTIAIIGKFIQMFVYLDFSKAINSNTLKTNAIDTRNDIISTTTILISMIIMGIFNINIDGYLGLLVSGLIIYSSIGLIKEVLEPIIGIIPTEERIKEVTEKILSYDCVRGIHDLVIHNYGVHNDFITVHVEISSDMDIMKAHDLMDNIEKDFKTELGTDLTIHMDPVDISNPKANKLYDLVKNALLTFDLELKMHDFRIVEGVTHTNILFDVIVPFEKNYTKEQIIEHLNKNVISENEKYYYVIDIDRPYI